jgi:D-alanyl-D-alanine carboxypeptidase (penicillin-binding protein 5/6)
MTNFDLIEIVKKDTAITELDVWLGKKNKVKTYLKNNVYKTIPKARKKYLKVTINYNGPVNAPIKKDDILGKLKISYKDKIIDEHDLLAFENVKKLNIFSRLIRSINYLIWGDV